MQFPAHFLSCEVEIELCVESEDLKEDEKPGVVWEPSKGEMGKSGDKRKGKRVVSIVLGPRHVAKEITHSPAPGDLYLFTCVLWSP